MATTYTHTFSTNGTSSVIDKVFYSEHRQELYVQLLVEDYWGNKIVAGYEGVPLTTYMAMELENASRLSNGPGSVGSYWNTWGKRRFSGFDTDGIDLVPAEEESRIGSFFASDAKDVKVEEVAGAEEVSVVADRYFTVTYSENPFEDKEFPLYASSEDDALVRFNKIAEIAGWDNVEVTALTRHFDV